MNGKDMTPEALVWAEEHGVEFDEDGDVKLAAVSGPPQTCARCGVLAERPSEFAAWIHGRDVSGVQCHECSRLSMSDLKAWAAGFPKL